MKYGSFTDLLSAIFRHGLTPLRSGGTVYSFWGTFSTNPLWVRKAIVRGVSAVNDRTHGINCSVKGMNVHSESFRKIHRLEGILFSPSRKVSFSYTKATINPISVWKSIGIVKNLRFKLNKRINVKTACSLGDGRSNSGSGNQSEK